MKRIVHIFKVLLLLGIIVSMSDYTAIKAAAGTVISITGLEIGDNVELYRIASFGENDSKYEWEDAVKDWIQNKSEGSSYKGMAPEQLSQMTVKGSKEFCQKLLVGLKNDSKKIANLDGYSFIIDEEKQEYQLDNVVPGYYIVIPKGTNRIYELKWTKASAEKKQLVSYNASDGDYQIPSVKAKVNNTTLDRGVVSGAALTYGEDEVEVSSTIAVPRYPDTYATGKRMLNVTIVVPPGLEYIKDSLELSLTDESAYSVGEYKAAIVYENDVGDIMFFGTDKEYYYELNGNILVSGGTEKEALDRYNIIHETAYNLNGTLEKKNGYTVLVIALDTEKDISKVTVQYRAMKNNIASSDGYYNNIVALSYSVSPLDADLTYSALSKAPVASYGITIVACEGSGESINMTAEEKLEKSPRFGGVVFELYRLSGSCQGDVTGGQVDDESGEPPLLIYNQEEDVTYKYAYVTSLTTDNNGTVSIAGLEEDDYIIEQKVYPSGYTLSDSSLHIAKDAWTDDTVMEGDNDLFVIWLEYETRYLPGTGSIDALLHYILGFLISAAALLILYNNLYKNDDVFVTGL